MPTISVRMEDKTALEALWLQYQEDVEPKEAFRTYLPMSGPSLNGTMTYSSSVSQRGRNLRTTLIIYACVVLGPILMTWGALQTARIALSLLA